MTQTELISLLKTTGYDVAYHHFEERNNPPFVVFLRTDDENISSDYKVHGKFKNYQIELYTRKKDLVAEKKIEDVIGEIYSEYSTSETYIESEKLYQVVYQITVVERS